MNRKVYLGLHDSASYPEPDSRDEQRVREYMIQKYEHKRWYVAPTDTMKEAAKLANEAALNNKPQVKPFRSQLGENAAKFTSTTAQSVPAIHAPVQVSVPLPGGFKPPSQIQAPATTTASKASSGFDLFGDFGSDPFASSSTGSNPNENVDGFADFSSFDSVSSSSTHQPATTQEVLPSPAFPIAFTPLQPATRGQALAATAPNQPTAQAVASWGDKYAALADLNSAFSAPVTTATAISWGGSDGGAINWGGSSSSGGTTSQGGLSSGWGVSSASNGGISWNGQGSLAASAAPHSVVAAPSSATNPFAGVPLSGPPSYAVSAATVNANPFGGSTSASQFSPAGMSATTGYGGHLGMQGQPAGFGQFSALPNGGYGMASPAGNYAVQGSFMMPAQPGSVQQMGSWSQFGPAPVSQPVSNPFMSASMQQKVLPPSSSTNPFL
ncbi:unnamed protein product [Candidula unifasciata]|uniref:Uncharacterized protein n=1 Tax=Candidula unifasciata TaxID=100452 RepID=A0A8S3YMT2_9EUPU|nr:unnamed protein product [Candidula unifasciata]